MRYDDYIKSKALTAQSHGFIVDDGGLPNQLFGFQRDCVKWALMRGKAALFLDTGLGKTACQLSWARAVAEYTGNPVIIVAPLCVAHQTVREGAKFGISAKYMRHPADQLDGVIVTNYEMIENFDLSMFAGVVLDESSILKGMNGKYREMLTNACRLVPYKLSCTATPSPNDFMELGTQCEWLGIMTQREMLAMYFIHDGGSTSSWRLKGHGKTRFWEWMATWSIVLRMPSDIGYSDDGYDLPPIQYHEHTIVTGDNFGLFARVAQGLNERNSARRESIDQRVRMAAKIANAIKDDPVIIWCHLNSESSLLESMIPGSRQVTGSMPHDEKERLLLEFTNGELRILISKPSIAGFGMNWQHCNQVIFVGLSDSWEKYYQAIRRCYRFGQCRDVNVHIIAADTEGAVVENIRRKDLQHNEMSDGMTEHMRAFTLSQIRGAISESTEYMPEEKLTMPSFMGETA